MTPGSTRVPFCNCKPWHHGRHEQGLHVALTDDILHPEEIPPGVIGAAEVDLNAESLSSAHDQPVVDVLVGVVVHLVAVPPLLEQVDTRDSKVVYTQRKQ